MLVEMRLEDAARPAATQTQPETETAALRELITAGLVTHEAIGDPARLAGEAATLRAICGVVAGPVYRLEPFHYAFAARPEDLGGALAGLAPAARTAALTAALAAALGPEAIWIGATELLPEETETPATEAGAAAAPWAPVMLLRAHADAVTEALAAAEPGTQAVIDARYAVACARLTVGAEASALEPRLVAIETALRDTRVALAARSETTALLARLSQALNTVLRRLDVQSGVLHAHIAREDVIAERLAELSQIARGPGAFQETLGLTLAEFLAGIERRTERPADAPVRAQQAV